MNLPHGFLPERIEALLAPDGLRLHRNGNHELAALAATPGADSEDNESWRRPLAALDRELRARPAHSLQGVAHLPAALAARLAPKLDVVLSEHFVRWLPLPWQVELDTPEEQEAYARHSFREVYGEVARHWLVRCAAQPPGGAIPACAIDGALVTALRQLAATHGCLLGSLRPLFALAVDRWQRRLPRGITWFAMLEPGWLSLGLLRNGRWQAMHGEPAATLQDSGELLAGLIARSAISAGIAPGEGRMVLCGEGADQCPVPLPEEAVKRVGSALPWTTASRKERQFA